MTRAFPRPTALLMTLVVVAASLLAVSSAEPAGAVPSAAARPSSAGIVAPRVDAYGDSPGDATMANVAAIRARTTITGRGSTADGHCIVNGAGTCRWNYAAKTDANGKKLVPEVEKVLCSGTVPICVHYAASGPDAPDGKITPPMVLDTLTHIYSVYRSSGYRMPEADHNTGTGATYTGTPVPADDIDIYLADIGDQGYYGYCSPEPLATAPRAHHTPAFCVLDNDYAEFPHGTAITNLDVTAAHEFFHAVQFAYDATEDPWFMESTAVWMEDEVYDPINDNTQYLPYGPLGRPDVPLDKASTFGVYGGWIFFRWVTEHRPRLVGQLPGIILSMWQRAAAGSGRDRYSLQAVNSAMAAAKMPLRTAFARFAAANRDPRHTYSEGAANRYPIAPPTKSYRLRTVSRTSGTAQINHLAAATERFTPKGPRLSGKRTRLRLRLNMADTKLGSAAVVTVFERNGQRKVHQVRLNRHGGGFIAVPFNSHRVKRVELTMTNASTRMRCWVGGMFSCQGQPKDMRQLERFSAAVHKG